MADSSSTGVIFDLDGTLVASESLYHDATEELLAPLGRSLAELTPAEKSMIPGRSALVNMEFYRKRFGLRQSARELVESRINRIIELVRERGVRVIEGAPEFLASLEGAGFGLALATSSPRTYADAILEVTGLGRFFRVVKTGDDVSRFKPDPEIFLAAAGALGVDPRKCLVVEDAHSGIQAAKRAGMKVLAILGDYTLASQYDAADALVPDFNGLGPEYVVKLIDRNRTGP